MLKKKNQHFVPQFLLRNFSDGGKHINLLLKATGGVIENARIKTQCSKDYFYGNDKIENYLSLLESEFAPLIHIIDKITCADEFSNFLQDSVFYTNLLRAIVLQKSRTEVEAEKFQSFSAFTIMEGAKIAIANDSKLKENAHLLNDARIDVDQSYAAQWQLWMNRSNSIIISDLTPFLLNNSTSFPFVIGDAPVVFYNLFAYHVKNIGVTAYASNGLMVFFPISPHKMIMLIDSNKYNISATGNFIDLRDYDVNNLNKLQLCNSLNSIYFPQWASFKYAKKLWKLTKKIMEPPHIIKEVFPYSNGKLLSFYETQIKYKLSLSIITPNVMLDPILFTAGGCVRNPKIIEQVRTLNKVQSPRNK